MKKVSTARQFSSVRPSRDERNSRTAISASFAAGKSIGSSVSRPCKVRISGVNEEYADLLEAAGVDTVVELAQRNAGNLHAQVVQVNDEKKLVRQGPASSQVEAWVEEATTLPRLVTH